ncbi:helix-turn-helix transcriptional regulator [Emcibacter nanhaiensis]|uniref:Helix-turn-helix domain-containing protein n=1 Tax=Emcibacter nanhaiensis TaxID=1505037 RepID=A0A501PIN0_9PROT|nr:helix-turn-helix transcriptional regulator [Emcibacter nanhaiensis]TPD59861.1 helix-turn-helix domain-containing protein [Emcibacter nanhaiensis]
MTQRDELVRFLKNARARIKPSDVGLPEGGRRRTSGLRREEVATLTGMSVTWYTWFEQGREVQLSRAMLEGLSRTLLLNPQEREYLLALARKRPRPLVVAQDEVIHPATQQMMDGLNIPAQVITEDWTVIGWNHIVTRLFRDYAERPASERNLFKILMLDKRYRKDPDSFREMAKRLTARFKWDYSRTNQTEKFDAIIQEMLNKSKTFKEFWFQSDIIAHLEGVHTVTAPEFGDITVRHTSYTIEEAPSQRLILFVPTDDVSRERLDQVALSDS